MGERLQVVMDAVSDERAWCMFVSAVLAADLKADVKYACQQADTLLKEFHARFRGADGDGEEDDDDDDEDD